DLGRLQSLDHLDVSGNLLTSLPGSLCDLRKLTSLAAHRNRIGHLPARLNTLSQLVSVDFSYNRISTFPDEGISNLTKLRELNLRGNDIRSLPAGISGLPELMSVQLVAGQPEVLPFDNLEREWDVFISYASEDASTVVQPLATLLERAGVRVWLDSWEIRVGDRIRQSIDEGLRRSRFGL